MIFSKITNEIKTATSFTKIRLSSQDTSEHLSYLSSNGDIFLSQTYASLFSDDNTYIVADTDYIEVGFGKIPYLYDGHQFYGAYVYNKIAQTLTPYGFERQSMESAWTRNYYLGVIVDYTNVRAYMLLGFCTYNMQASQGWVMDLFGGVVNGVDYVYESFKDREV